MAKKQSYQSLSQELDKLLTELQSGELDIDAAIAAYEKGQKLIGRLQEYLKAAENKIEQVITD